MRDGPDAAALLDQEGADSRTHPFVSWQQDQEVQPGRGADPGGADQGDHEGNAELKSTTMPIATGMSSWRNEVMV